jgi:antitoxin PrlF
MAKPLIASLTSKGQLTLPKTVRELLRVGMGDYLRFEPRKGGVFISKLRLDAEEFTENEWQALERLANRAGRRYKTAKEFLRDLKRL